MSISEEFKSRWRTLLSKFIATTSAENDARSVPAAQPAALDKYYVGEYRQMFQDAANEINRMIDEEGPVAPVQCPEVGCKGRAYPGGNFAETCEDLCPFKKTYRLPPPSRSGVTI